METTAKNDLFNSGVNQTQSKFHIKSIGYAAENLKLDSLELEITPVEDLGYLHGEVNSDREVIEESGVDAYGNAYSVKIETSNAMIATWLPLTSNRLTPPNIRRGERVLLWQYADTDKYYWTELGLDDHLRRLETVTYTYSNTKDEKTEKLTPDNSYFLEVSTHYKLITLKTNKSDGEPYAYTIQLNTKNGHLVITDDINNTISLESREKRIRIVNADNSLVEVDKNVCNINTSNSVNINTGTFNVSAGTSNINSTTNINGNTATTGTLINNGTNVGSTHTHGGIKPGPSRTSTPG